MYCVYRNTQIIECNYCFMVMFFNAYKIKIFKVYPKEN